MQFASSGNTIVKIFSKRKKIYLILDDNREIEINENIIAEFLLYNGKRISDQEIKSIQQDYLASNALTYAYGLLSRRSYTEKEIVDRLKKKTFSQTCIDQVINKIKLLKLIDDKNYVREYIECAKHKGYGPLRIKKELFLKGIKGTIVDEFLDSNVKVSSIDKKLISKLTKQFDASNDKKKRQQIHENLYRRGFTNDAINEVLEKYVVYDGENERKVLLRDYKKLESIYLNKYENAELVKRIVSKLMQKGYNYHDIMAIKEENDD